MARKVLEYIGGFVIVAIIYFLYRTWTDDLIDDDYWRGFLAGTFLSVLVRLQHDLLKVIR